MVEWGGQLELRALSLALNRPIRIYSADSPVMVIGEDIDVDISHTCHVERAYLSFLPQKVFISRQPL